MSIRIPENSPPTPFIQIQKEPTATTPWIPTIKEPPATVLCDIF